MTFTGRGIAHFDFPALVPRAIQSLQQSGRAHGVRAVGFVPVAMAVQQTPQAT
jgi:hypothetical protein